MAVRTGTIRLWDVSTGQELAILHMAIRVSVNSVAHFLQMVRL